MVFLLLVCSFSSTEIDMLVRITNSCRMGCNHCMIDATPSGEHMSTDMFSRSLAFIKLHEFRIVMLSGGEPTDHPNFLIFAQMAKDSGLHPLILSNGMFLEDERKRDEILSLGIPIQITNDERFYPKKIVKFEHPLLSYEDNLRVIVPLGRAKTNNLQSERMSPLCFNLRSAIRTLHDFRQAVLYLRLKGKMCTPSINVDGSIVAGESSFCHVIGTIDSIDSELVKNIISMECNKCGLETNLSSLHRAVIGLWKN